MLNRTKLPIKIVFLAIHAVVTAKLIKSHLTVKSVSLLLVLNGRINLSDKTYIMNPNCLSLAICYKQALL